MNIVELLIVGATIDLINKSSRIEYEGTSIFIDDTALSRNQLKILDSAYGLIFSISLPGLNMKERQFFLMTLL